MNLRVGDVFLIYFDGINSEQRGVRPGVIIQNNTGNLHSKNTIAIPLTTSIKRTEIPTHVVIQKLDSGLQKDSMALCENPQRISKQRIIRYITTLSDKYMAEIAKASVIAMGVISFISIDDLTDIWKDCLRLNHV